jgi:hypothetical protein
MTVSTISAIPSIDQTTALILTMVTSHHERWKTKHSHKDTSQTQHHIRWNTCTITNDYRAKQFYTNNKPNPIGIQGIGNQINACKCVTRGRKNIGSTWSRNTYHALRLAAAQSLVLQGLEDFWSSQRLINNDQKQAILRINKTVNPKVPK